VQKSIETTTDKAGIAIEVFTLASFILAFLMSASVSQLWGTLRVMQTVILVISLRKVPLPANTNTFLGVFVEI